MLTAFQRGSWAVDRATSWISPVMKEKGSRVTLKQEVTLFSSYGSCQFIEEYCEVLKKYLILTSNLQSTTCSFFSPSILLHRKWEGGVSVRCSYRQSKRSWVFLLQYLRTWESIPKFIFQEQLLRKFYRRVLGNEVLGSITVLIHIVLAMSLKTLILCLQYTWSGNLDVRYKNFKSSFHAWGETQQSCWVATRFCYVHKC